MNNKLPSGLNNLAVTFFYFKSNIKKPAFEKTNAG